MSSSKSKFLLDENVRSELEHWLHRRGVDAVRSPKGSVNGALGRRSVAEERILVTNDQDFSQYAAGSVFGVVWLRIAQDDPEGLIASFAPLLDWPSARFKGKVVVLSLNAHEILSLGVQRRLK